MDATVGEKGDRRGGRRGRCRNQFISQTALPSATRFMYSVKIKKRLLKVEAIVRYIGKAVLLGDCDTVGTRENFHNKRMSQ